METLRELNQKIEDLFLQTTRLFNEGRIDEVANAFEAPLPVYAGGDLVLHASREETRKSLMLVAEGVARLGATHLTLRIVSILPGTKSRSQVARIEWQYRDNAGKIVALSEINYYCGQISDGSIKIMMVEYLKVGVPETLADLSRDDTPRTIN